MSAWEVKKGNTSIQDMLIKDRDGNTVTNLSSATEIKFQVKASEKEGVSALIEKTVGSGIEVDTPSTGYLRITLAPSDSSSLNERDYFMAVQIKWSSSTYEVIIKIDNVETKTFSVKRGMIT